jgi:hypothetical protein
MFYNQFILELLAYYGRQKKLDDEIYWMSGNLQKKHSLKLPMYLSMKKIETRFIYASICLHYALRIPDAP